jgi:hypothetical protein
MASVLDPKNVNDEGEHGQIDRQQNQPPPTEVPQAAVGLLGHEKPR